MLPFGLFSAAAIGAQLILHAIGKDFCLTQLTMAVYYSLVVMGLCLVMGYAGQVSLGHAAFFAIGGYSTAILTTTDFSRFKGALWAELLTKAQLLLFKDDLFGGQILTASPWAAFAGAMVVTLVVACVIGYPALRLKGHYLAMATLGFGLIINKLVIASSITGAADGITGVPEWKIAPGLAVCGKSGSRISNYYIACVLALIVLILLRNLIRSRVGRALQAIHDRETAANAMGIDTASYKLKAFVFSAMLAAIAGVFFTHYTGGISPSEAGVLKSVRYVALAAVGGMSNLWGVAVIGILINFLSLRDWFGSYDNAVFGVLLISIISLAPEGPLKPISAWFRRVMAGRKSGGEHGAA
jgi:branched-chain amino acid transport system permease protein